MIREFHKKVMKSMVGGYTPSDDKRCNVVLFGIYYADELKDLTKNKCIAFGEETGAKHGTELFHSIRHVSKHVVLGDDAKKAIESLDKETRRKTE